MIVFDYMQLFIIIDKLFNAELFVIVAVRTQGEVNIGVILSGSASLDSAEIIVEIASINFLMAVFTLFICPVFPALSSSSPQRVQLRVRRGGIELSGGVMAGDDVEGLG